jgi:hypothetical protein
MTGGECVGDTLVTETAGRDLRVEAVFDETNVEVK